MKRAAFVFVLLMWSACAFAEGMLELRVPCVVGEAAALGQVFTCGCIASSYDINKS